MDIDGMDIKELFRNGILTANAVRIILEQQAEYYDATAENTDVISPDRLEHMKRKRRGEPPWHP